MKRPHVTIFLYSLASGGAERVVSYLLPYLNAQYQITLVLMNRTIHYSIPQNIPIVFLESSHAEEPAFLKLLKLPWLAWRYKKWLQTHNVSISFSLMNRPNYINTLAALFGASSRIIVSERGAPSQQYQGRSLFARINRFLIRNLYPLADHITVNSQGSRLDLQEHFNIDKPISVLYNPLDLHGISAIQPLEYTNDQLLRCISVGRLDEGKNFHLQINVLSQLRQHNIRLDILGNGPLKKTLTDYIHELHLHDRIYLQGRQQPFPWLLSASIFLFSSLREGFPNVLLEALACKLAIIATDCSNGPRELLAPDTDPHIHLKEGYEFAEYGVLVAVDDTHAFCEALLLLLTRPDLIESYRNKATIRAEQFNIQNTLPQYKKVINAYIQ